MGAKLELETYDDGGDASTAANGAQKFADDDSILAIGGSCLTSCTAAMLPITGDAEMPQLVVSSSAKSLTGISDYFFRMAVQDAAVGPQIANQFTKMGKTKAVTLYCNNDYGSGLKDSSMHSLKQTADRFLTPYLIRQLTRISQRSLLL